MKEEQLLLLQYRDMNINLFLCIKRNSLTKYKDLNDNEQDSDVLSLFLSTKKDLDILSLSQGTEHDRIELSYSCTGRKD